ncbi:GNAT family N-acetyltransferase [Streptomyces scopuliridis]
MHERVTIRPADLSEVEAIASMWRETSKWLHSKEVDQWQYPADEEKITRDVTSGTAYVVTGAGKYLGTITVDENADPEFWAKKDLPTEAIYGHRIIILPHARGKSVGATVLDWASRKAEKAGKRWLRVDAWKTNTELARYYEGQGFEHVRTVDLPHRRSGALFQREAGTITGAGPGFLGLESPLHEADGTRSTEGQWGWYAG